MTEEAPAAHDGGPDDAPRSRRSVLRAAGAGAVAAGAAAVGLPVAVAGGSKPAGTPGPDPVLQDTRNETLARTTIRSDVDGNAAFLGQAVHSGVGVFGHSATSLPETAPATGGTFSGVLGVGDDATASGVAGLGGVGVYGLGAVGAFGDALGDSAGVYGYSGDDVAPGAVAGVGVTAEEGAGGRAGLQVIGRARFSRSGRAKIVAGKDRKKVFVPGATLTSMVFATLATDRPNRWVRAVVPKEGSFVVILNGTVTGDTFVNWVMLDPTLA